MDRPKYIKLEGGQIFRIRDIKWAMPIPEGEYGYEEDKSNFVICVLNLGWYHVSEKDFQMITDILLSEKEDGHIKSLSELLPS